MGIVAFCPNGHRVKVKDELAGRKGICPTCSARFRIPRKGAELPRAAAGDEWERPPPARVLSLDPLVASTLPVACALDDADTVDAIEPAMEPGDALPDFVPVSSGEDDPGPVENPPDRPPGGLPAAGSRPAHAALDERPELAWCHAIRGGTPSTPLTAADMRAWLDSGAASTGHVVWRADWPEWRPLGEVFPEALPLDPRGSP